MSELKWNWVYYPYLDAPNKQEESALKAGYIKVVIKDEADAVIKELKAQKAQAEDDCAYWKTKAQSEHHHKYKRCLDKAELCRLEQERIELIENQDITDYDFNKLVKGFYKKWQKRWLEIAEQFKGADDA